MFYFVRFAVICTALSIAVSFGVIAIVQAVGC